MYSAGLGVGFDHILAAVISERVFKERVHLAVRGGNFFLKHRCHWEKQMKSWVI